MIRRKRLQITEKKPGAIEGEHPEIIYANMIRRVQRYHWQSKIAMACSLRNKFNNILNEGASKQGHKIMNLKACCTLTDFDASGNLTLSGKTVLWHEIDDLMARYEDENDRRVDFRPVTATSTYDRHRKEYYYN